MSTFTLEQKQALAVLAASGKKIVSSFGSRDLIQSLGFSESFTSSDGMSIYSGPSDVDVATMTYVDVIAFMLFEDGSIFTTEDNVNILL